MVLKEVNIADIKPSKYNPPMRTNTSAGIKGLREDIKQRGLIEPLTVDRDMTLINGHRRFRCIVELNWKKVSVIQHDIEQKTSDEYFLSTNEHTLKMNGAQFLWRYLNDALIPQAYLKKYILPLEAWMGKKHALTLFRELIRRDMSPATIYVLMNLYRSHTGETTQFQMRKLCHYTLNIEAPFRIKTAMYNFIPKKVLNDAIHSGSKLKPKYTI
tara:strand:- start:215 stop:856 length:642 start_codon:yes stop_codon:yes gene_type:complete